MLQYLDVTAERRLFDAYTENDCAESEMEKITSRKNAFITHLRTLASDAGYRREQAEFLCDGLKLLSEAMDCGAEILSILWKEDGAAGSSACPIQYIAPADLFDYVSPMKNSPGPLFTVRLPGKVGGERIDNAIVLENVQDPGNVGTVLRTANALCIGAVVLIGECADLYSPKTVRATMGAIFRQRIFRLNRSELPVWLEEHSLPLIGAALSKEAKDLRKVDITHSAVAVGSEGQGLSKELLSMCRSTVIIPMDARSESLNAAVAAAVFMWEMSRAIL